MPRPNQTAERRRELLPVVAQAFAELGYRRTTTAELAERCGVRENILYRLWPDKKAMFIASIHHVFQSAADTWRAMLAGGADDGRSVAERLLAFESRHHGEFGRYRIVFAGLSETDDPDIRAALRRMYLHFQRLVRKEIAVHRGKRGASAAADVESAAWAIVGLGTVANITRELGLISGRRRQRLFAEAGRVLLDGRTR
jgi:AcrR family transcriptional regulator